MAQPEDPWLSLPAAVAAGAAVGLGVGAAWGSAADESPPALSGARGADAAVLGVGLAAWLGTRLLDRRSPPLAEGRFSDCRQGRDALPGVDRWFRARVAASPGSRRTAARWADLTLAAAVAQPFGLALGAQPEHAGRDVAVVAGTLGVTMALNAAAKGFFDRARPYAHYCEPLSPGGLCARDAQYSFYSGHASAAFAAAFLSARLAEMHELEGQGRVWATGLGLATATAVLQMRADKHYFTDVAMGALTGSLLGWFLPTLHRPSAEVQPTGPPAAPAALAIPLPPPRGNGSLQLRAGYAGGLALGVDWRF